MAAKNLRLSIAEMLLSGDGLAISQRIVEEMFKAAKPATEPDRVESLGRIRGALRKLGEEDGE